MSNDDGLLSQSDIDALTAGLGLGSPSKSAKAQTNEGIRKFLKILSEQSSGVISTVLSRSVEFQLNQVIEVSEFDPLHSSLEDQALKINVRFGRELNGQLVLVIAKKAVAVLADLMLMGGGTAEYSEEHKDAIQEIVNQIMGSFSTTLTTEVGLSVEVAPQPAQDFDSKSSQDEFAARGDIVLHVEGFPDQYAYWYLDPAMLESLLASKMNEDAGAGLDTNLASLGLGSSNVESSPTSYTGSSNSSPMMPAYEGGSMGGMTSFSSTGNKALDLLMDIELPITIELGRTRLSLKRILELGPGAIVEMERFAGEPVDILINGKVVAKGEVVVVDENFGVRLVGLVTPEERIKMLR